jgi:hypothetical protein
MMLSRSSILAALAACSLLFLVQQPADADSIVGIAAMGASETQGTGYDGSWVPWLSTNRGLNFGPGDSYNRAIGGSSSSDLLAEGEHTQVANLVSNGNVNLAFLTVGGLDFPPKATQILAGTLNIPAFTSQVTGNILTAVDTVLAAGPAKMIVNGIPDMTLTGGGQRTLTIPLAKQRTLNVVNAVNAALEPEVLGRGQTFVDFAGAMQLWTLNPLVIGGVTINTHDESTDPDHIWLNDLHVNAIGNGLFANLMLSAINKTYGLNIPLFSDQELLQNSGLGAQYTGQTSSIDYQSFVHVPVPEPSSLTLAALGLAALAIHRRKRRV